MANLTRICLTGPESTGKTTLAGQLADASGAGWVPEFVREYAIQRENRLVPSDCDVIARGQIELEENLASGAHGLLVLDTDLISTVVYARHYYGSCPSWIVDEARRRRASFYLLMDTDIEWVADPARDRGGDAREDLFDAFRQALDEFDTEWSIVSGTGDERLKRALELLELWQTSRRSVPRIDAT
jgi:NadR type nicotinamide-nucleotide adenylyltransferase